MFVQLHALVFHGVFRHCFAIMTVRLLRIVDHAAEFTVHAAHHASNALDTLSMMIVTTIIVGK